MSASVVVVGGPDSGKTNYIARLWTALREKKGELVEAVQPTDLDFVCSWPTTSSRANSSSDPSRRRTGRDFEVTVAARADGKQAEDRHP